MIIYRQHIYSSKKKKGDSKKSESESEPSPLGEAGVKKHFIVDKKLYQGSFNLFNKENEELLKDPNNKKLNKELIKRAKKEGVKVVNDKKFENSAYLGIPFSRKTREYLEKNGNLDSYKKQMEKEFKSKAVGENIGTDTIVMGNLNSPAVLSHELGHAAMSDKGRSNDIIGKAAHTSVGTLLDTPYILVTTNNKKFRNISRGALFAAGIKHGYSSSNKKEKNDLVGARREGWKGIRRGALISAPVLIQEAAASRKGIKYLREAGATEEQIKHSKKSLAGAFGTYVSAGLAPIIIEAGGTLTGMGIHALKRHLEKKKK